MNFLDIVAWAVIIIAGVTVLISLGSFVFDNVFESDWKNVVAFIIAASAIFLAMVIVIWAIDRVIF